MRLSHLELRNFRCFESLDLDLADTTVLVGANDTGKSAILEAVHILFGGPISNARPERRWAEPDWRSMVRSGGPPSGFAVSASIVADIDLGHEALDWFGASAPGGVIRLGRSSALPGGHWIVFSPDHFSALVDAFDLDSCREYFKIQSRDQIAGAMRTGGFLFEHEGRLWLDPGIWEFGVGSSMAGWDIVDSDSEIRLVASIPLGGPHETSWSPQAVLEPILARALTRVALGSDAHEALPDPFYGIAGLATSTQISVDNLMAYVGAAHSRALSPVSDIQSIDWNARVDLTDAIVRGLRATVTVGDHAGRRVGINELGPGSRRSLAVAALDLYRDPLLWPPHNEDVEKLPMLAVLLIEEPETGLHPAAQRAMTQSLRRWATYGLQMLVVTHSPTFVNVADPSGIRLARKVHNEAGETVRTAVRPDDLAEIRDELGVRPSDILLARRFVIVEGDTDRAVLDVWAHRLGYSLTADGVQLVASGGYGMAQQIARFLGLAYEGAEFIVVFDNGSDTAKEKLVIESRFGTRVRVELLSRTDIEGFYPPEAVSAWLRMKSPSDDDIEPQVTEALAKSASAVRALQQLSLRYLGRPFDKVSDGIAIANLTTEARIDPEITGLLMRLAAD